jgi:hypothetical protein
VHNLYLVKKFKVKYNPQEGLSFIKGEDPSSQKPRVLKTGGKAQSHFTREFLAPQLIAPGLTFQV